ncbi:hypothetical protein SMAC4_13253 [Sordaria macrospora]|nr:hypothetical protein SMAC4_13253 [Sordaria macrospora]
MTATPLPAARKAPPRLPTSCPAMAPHPPAPRTPTALTRASPQLMGTQ